MFDYKIKCFTSSDGSVTLRSYISYQKDDKTVDEEFRNTSVYRTIRVRREGWFRPEKYVTRTDEEFHVAVCNAVKELTDEVKERIRQREYARDVCIRINTGDKKDEK